MSIDYLRKQANNLQRLLPTLFPINEPVSIQLAKWQQVLARLHGCEHWGGIERDSSGEVPSHLKKQAKNLKTLLPPFLAQHPSRRVDLRACQDLVAQSRGFPGWAEAETRATAHKPSPDAHRAERDAAAKQALYNLLDTHEKNQLHQQWLTDSRAFEYDVRSDLGEPIVLEFMVKEVDAPSEVAAAMLQEEVERAYRMQRESRATILLNVLTPEIPAFVLGAMKRFYYFGIGVVLVHDGRCDLDPDCGFDPDLLRAIRQARGGMQVWHPLKRERVFGVREPLP